MIHATRSICTLTRLGIAIALLSLSFAATASAQTGGTIKGSVVSVAAGATGAKLSTLALFCGEPRSEPEIESADSQQQYAGNGRRAPVAGPGPRQEQRNTDHCAERRHRKG